MNAMVSVKRALGIVVLMFSTNGLAQAAGAANGGGDGAASGSVHTDTTTAMADRKLEKDVHHALGETKHLTSRDIRVHAAAGVVTLSGSVPNRAALDRAAQAAQGVPGVTAVRNNLTIENR
ncbi:transport-associated protein [Paraburkholderia hospita]|uniref:Transport-associated protein n=1 Tax=Paraburkholderia hospita TaxID=169430 RepID=A0ABP2PVF0_9BURK|nr:BON domain-containing protein [Paraburkholderia hospita]EIN01801.1 transport-associated protein [Paraburkholderia hospita]OUL73682.1 transporter [Paraburkholderia hospita]OUL93139.1 transporter [Paraburkholderia hospita]